MFEELLATEQAIKNVVSPFTFLDPEGNNAAMRYYLGAMPRKREEAANGSDIPFCLIKPGGFGADRQGREQAVDVVFNLHIPGDRRDALEWLSTFITAVEGAEKERFTPCKVAGKITGQAPEIDHPIYQITVSLNLYKARV